MNSSFPDSWCLIESDPALRLELRLIERAAGNPEELVGMLLDFYGKVDRLFLFSSFIPRDRLAADGPCVAV